MWIYTKYGFISVVKYVTTITDDLMVVRARRQKHLEALFPDREDIFYSPDSDYSYRLYLSRKDFTDFLVDLGNDIDYPNFKAALPLDTPHDASYYATCMDVWTATYSRLGRFLHAGTRTFAGLVKDRVVQARPLPKD